MKKILTMIVLGTLLSGSAGCRIAECWNYAWNSRFPPRQAQPSVVFTNPTVISDEACFDNPCSSPCSSPCSAPAITPSPIPAR